MNEWSKLNQPTNQLKTVSAIVCKCIVFGINCICIVSFFDFG